MARPAYDELKRKGIEAEIRAHALRLFARSGYRNVSLRAIAAEMRWSATALYRYYSSKEMLLDAIRAEGFMYMREVLASVRTQSSNPLQAAANAMQAYVRFAGEQSVLYQLMYELDQSEIEISSQVSENRRLAFAEAIKIAESISAQEKVSMDAVEMAHLFWISAHGLAALSVAHQLDLGKGLADLVNPAVSALLRGLRVDSSEGRS